MLLPTRPILVLLSVLGALLAGCGEKAAAPAKPNSTSAPANPLKSAAKSQTHAVRTVDLATLNKAVELFYVQEGRFPRDLAEVVEKKIIPEIPPVPVGMKLVYDATAGIVRVERE